MNRRTSILAPIGCLLAVALLAGAGLFLGVFTGIWNTGAPAGPRPAPPTLSSTPDPTLPARPGAASSLAPFTAGGWNVGLDDADPQVIAQLLADFQGVDLWGLAEVNDGGGAVGLLEAAVEAGEDADFGAVLGASGGAQRLLALYNARRFDLLGWQELDAINTTGNARAPLVLHLREHSSGAELLFMVNHLYRSREEERLRQAQLLAQWAAEQALPVVAVGDYNLDWALRDGERDHDAAYDALTANGIWQWVHPAELVTTQCSGWPCTYNSVLDFVFTAGPARQWPARSVIAVVPGDFPDDAARSDHRAVLAQFAPGGAEGLAGETVLIPPRMPVQASATPTSLPSSPAASSPGQSSVIIADIFYDGVVPEVESDEYIVLANEGSEPVNLRGWRINAGGPSQDFMLPDYWLAPGDQVRIYTGEVHPADGGLSLRSSGPVWRNSGDCGRLYTSAGALRSEYCY